MSFFYILTETALAFKGNHKIHDVQSACVDTLKQKDFSCEESAWKWACDTHPADNNAGLKGLCDETCSARGHQPHCTPYNEIISTGAEDNPVITTVAATTVTTKDDDTVAPTTTKTVAATTVTTTAAPTTTKTVAATTVTTTVAPTTTTTVTTTADPTTTKTVAATTVTTTAAPTTTKTVATTTTTTTTRDGIVNDPWSVVDTYTNGNWPTMSGSGSTEPVIPDAAYKHEEHLFPLVDFIISSVDWDQILMWNDGVQDLVSPIYKGKDLRRAVEVMHKRGLKLGTTDERKRLYLGDTSPEGHMKGLANIALFLGQALHEAIKYNACDENNWDTFQSSTASYYTSASACGQLGQDYDAYGEGCEDACPSDPNMVILASTSAIWYGAPAPLHCGPKTIFPHALKWNYGGWNPSVKWDPQYMNNTHGDKFSFIKNHLQPIYETNSMGEFIDHYPTQKAGYYQNDGPGMYPNTVSAHVQGWGGKDDVEGCCWWGRGVIQTTGRCNIGKLNKYLVKEFYADALGSDMDLCRNPQLICDSTEFPELKWNAGLFFWIAEVQDYGRMNSTYASWNIDDKMDAWFQVGHPLSGPEFEDLVVGVSGIVNRGCPELICQAGEVNAMDDRRHKTLKVLRAFGF